MPSQRAILRRFAVQADVFAIFNLDWFTVRALTPADLDRLVLDSWENAGPMVRSAVLCAFGVV